MGSGGQSSIKKKAPAAAAAKAAVTAAAAPTGSKAASTSITPNLDKFTALNGPQRGQEITKAVNMNAAKAGADWASPFQKFVNNSGYDDKPTVLDEDEFDKADGITLYRTVNTGTGITAVGIANQIGNEDACLYNTHNGGQAIGKGLYTTPKIGGSWNYGSSYNSPSTAMMQFKIKPGAKIINVTDLSNKFNAEAANPNSYAAHIKRICAKADHDPGYLIGNAVGIYALSKGYSVVTDASGSTQATLQKALASGKDYYTVILNRGAVYMNRTTKMITRVSSTPWKQLAKNADID